MSIARFQDFCKNIRALDKLEVELMQGKKFSELNLSNFAQAEVCYEETTGEVYCVGGIDAFEGKIMVWLLCTYKVEEHPVKFLRFMKNEIQERLREYPLLENYAWLGNDLHIKWLKWMGAQFGDIFKSAGSDEGFVYFVFRKE